MLSLYGGNDFEHHYQQSTVMTDKGNPNTGTWYQVPGTRIRHHTDAYSTEYQVPGTTLCLVAVSVPDTGNQIVSHRHNNDE